MATTNETVKSIVNYIRHMADNMPNGVILNIAQCNFIADRINAAHNRSVKASRRRAERNAIYNVLESGPRDFGDNHEANEWLAKWQKYADGLHEGGKYAEYRDGRGHREGKKRSRRRG